MKILIKIFGHRPAYASKHSPWDILVITLRNGMAFADLLTLLLIALKCCNAIDISWGLVSLPLLVKIGLTLLINVVEENVYRNIETYEERIRKELYTKRFSHTDFSDMQPKPTRSWVDQTFDGDYDGDYTDKFRHPDFDPDILYGESEDDAE